MPATEQTWRDQKLMHVVFAVTGVLMLISTVWMLAEDHTREWKPYQRTARQIDLQMTEWREQQYQTEDLERQRAELEALVLSEQSKALDEQLLEQFQQEVNQDRRRRGEEPLEFTGIEPQQQRLQQQASNVEKLRQAVGQLRANLQQADQEIAQAQTELAQAQQPPAATAKKGAQPASPPDVPQLQAQLEKWQQYKVDTAEKLTQLRQQLAEAEQAAAATRTQLLAELQDDYLRQARFREDNWLNARKFKAAKLDAAKADLGLAVRDNRPDEVLDEKQAEVDRLEQGDPTLDEDDPDEMGLIDLTLRYQAASQHRRQLQDLLSQMRIGEVEAQTKLEESNAELVRLRESLAEQRATFVTWTGPKDLIPLPGKKILEMPILDAFNSPLEIENLWIEGLTIDYNFAHVRRFDRCTTCHQAVQKSMPGAATEPAYVHQRLLRLTMFAPTQEELAAYEQEREALLDAMDNPVAHESAAADAGLIGHLYGVRLADHGLVDRDDVTVSFVQPQSSAAAAVLQYDPETYMPRTGQQVQDLLLQPATFPSKTVTEEEEATTTEPRPGLMVGDVILAINGDEVRGKGAAEFRLRDAAGTGEPLQLTIRRGLPNPYTSHPRLDLFVGSMSPHDMTMFGCTICHEGQGSATDFKWASHTPNTLLKKQDWADDHGWFDNHHWIYPMYPTRFAQSSCLKCHHNVVELEPSERFPDPPAPKLMHGYHLIRKYGCFGCHEINGYSGQRRIGPDMRLEPNYAAAAQQIASLLNDAIEQHQQQVQAAGGETADNGQSTPQSPEGPPAAAAAESAELALLRQQLDVLQRTQETAAQLGQDSANEALRHRLVELLKEGAAAAVQPPEASEPVTASAEAVATEEPILPADVRQLAPLLEDTDNPGELRKVGPSLRYVDDKLDPVFMYDWIDDPQHFRPSTRMPDFFGHTKHLQGSQGEQLAKALEPIEILGIVAYLRRYSQEFNYLTPPEEIMSADAARGKTLFQERGCLACHSHRDFPEMEAYRPADEIVQGPDLSGLADKFDEQRNPQAPAWLYSWIKDPSRYHPRTLMPQVPLEPIEQTDAEGNVTVTDPAADIMAYLLQSSEVSWQPAQLAQTLFTGQGEEAQIRLPQEMRESLNQLTLEHLSESFYDTLAKRYLIKGIPADMRSELKGSELELLVSAEQFDDEEFRLPVDQKLVYIGNRSIAKYGCYGCHDIPGFEAAKPIGTTLSDWGRKEPARLAFEHIAQYLHHGDEHHGEEHGSTAEEHDELPPYFLNEILSGHREGFLYQKLREPRSYDYHKTDNKRYNEWLRMPEFPFANEEREAVMTFVLGLVAAPPADKFVYQVDPRRQAIVEGRKVLEKFNCGGCHMLESEKWDLNFEPEAFARELQIHQQAAQQTYPFLRPHFTAQELVASQQQDWRGLVQAIVSGMPTVSDNGQPQVFTEEGDPLEPDEQYDPQGLEFLFELYDDAPIDGHAFQSGVLPLSISSGEIHERSPAVGGTLARYLLPYVVQREKQVNPAAKGTEAWGWLPPPLLGEGEKVQADWLHSFLLDPYPIRPAVVLRMPKFNMTPDEATKLVNYFAAVDNARYPYAFNDRTTRDYLAQAAASYEGENRLQDAMRIVTDQNYCIKCHIVGDFQPTGRDIAKAPDLAIAHQRLQPEFLRRWIANPKQLLPYTSMPVNIPYDPNAPNLGGVSQDLYHGTSIEQLDALVDLLVNYDQYAKERATIAPLVQQAAPPAGAQPPADQPPAAAAPTAASGE